jgi:probable rRNA maturation factor
MTSRRRRPMSPPLQVVVTDARGRAVPSRGLPAFLASAAPPGTRGRVGIALIGDRTMRRLNREFRGQDHATDVLSFPEEGPAGTKFELRPSTGSGRPERVEGRSSNFEVSPGLRLGDLAIAVGLAGRQARRLGHSLGAELRVLALHGLLHLLGYDHDTDQGEMGRVEERLRRRAGLPIGLISRAPGRLRRR